MNSQLKNNRDARSGVRLIKRPGRRPRTSSNSRGNPSQNLGCFVGRALDMDSKHTVHQNLSLNVWRRGGDSNPRYGCPYAAFRVRCFQPLSHLSAARASQGAGRIPWCSGFDKHEGRMWAAWLALARRARVRHRTPRAPLSLTEKRTGLICARVSARTSGRVRFCAVGRSPDSSRNCQEVAPGRCAWLRGETNTRMNGCSQ